MEVLLPHWIVYASLWAAAAVVAALLATIAAVRAARTLRSARYARVLAPLTDDLLAVASGEDPSGSAAARLAAVSHRQRAIVERAIVSRLEFLRGTTARALTDVLESWGVRPRWTRRCRSLSASRRAAAVTDIGLLHDSGLADAVLPLLRDRSARVRTSAARAVGRMAAADGAAGVLNAVAPGPRGGLPMWVAMEGLSFPAAEGAVREALTHHSAPVRSAAAHAVALSGWPGTAPELRRALVEEDDQRARVQQVLALSVVGSDSDTALLQDLVAPDSARDVRVAAVAALAEVGGDINALADLLDAADPSVSRAAATALTQLGTRGRKLLATAGETSPVVAQEVALAHLHIRGTRPQLSGGPA